MAVDLDTLKSEILNDPTGVGYAGKDDGRIADLLNRASIATIEPESIPAADAQKAVVGSEYIALTQGQQSLWISILTVQDIPVKNPRIRAQIASVWGPGTQTRANLVALQSRLASRVEILFGGGAVATQETVGKALREAR